MGWGEASQVFGPGEIARKGLSKNWEEKILPSGSPCADKAASLQNWVQGTILAMLSAVSRDLLFAAVWSARAKKQVPPKANT